MITLEQAMNERHSVRRYKEQSLDAAAKSEIEERISECNRESGLHIQLVTDEPKAFDSMMAHSRRLR